MFSAGLDYFSKGGLLMYPLLLCSMAVVVIAVERFLFFHANDAGNAFTQKFCDHMLSGDWRAAKDLAVATKGEFGNLLTTIMARHGSLERLEEYVNIQASHVLDRFQKNLGYLNVAVSLAPVLGLLGTVTGMMASFSALDVRVDNPMAVTAGIGEALITTVFGLGIAIIGICAHAYFSKRLERVEINLEELTNAMLEAIMRDNCDDNCKAAAKKAAK